jgi:hypothetical protein
MLLDGQDFASLPGLSFRSRWSRHEGQGDKYYRQGLDFHMRWKARIAPPPTCLNRFAWHFYSRHCQIVGSARHTPWVQLHESWD